MECAAKFKNIKKQLGQFVLDIPDLKIRKGYITGFIGENGAGKTTTIKLILDMIKADEGNIEVLGMSSQEDAEKIKQEVGYVGEPTGYPEESKLKDIKRMLAPFYKNWEESLFEKYVTFFNIDLKKKYGKLSTGQKKQFAIVMALAHNPKFIILDEPTAGLDPVVRNEILDLLMEHMQNEEVTVFYSTHITSDLEKAGDYLVYIKDGRIIMDIEKDKVENEYCIVKGPKNLFEGEIRKELLGMRQTSFSTEALLESKKQAYELFGEEVKYVVPTIEDLMVFLAHKEGRRS